jgi:hypothetical protein
VLIEGVGGGTLNHLGVEVETGAEVEAAEARLSDDGVETTGVDDTICCYAAKTETWVKDPDGAPGEVYVKTGDAEQMTNTIIEATEMIISMHEHLATPVGEAPPAHPRTRDTAARPTTRRRDEMS